MLEWLGPEGDDLHRAFRRVFGERRREFGGPAIGLGGLSDGNEGVQWNAWIDRERGERWAGVNLEGMKYDGWPVGRLIRRELEAPTLPDLAAGVEGADRVVLLWTRDHWQATSRPRILESDIHPTPIALARLGQEDWRRALEGALACLDGSRNYQGRAKQQVTVVSKAGRRSRMGEVSPHLKLKTAMTGQHSWESFLEETKRRVQPLYEWVAERTRAGR